MKSKLWFLESLRGIAALSVAAYHFKGLSPLTNNAFVINADTMVDFFFVLSGFVIVLNYSDRIVSYASLRQFQVRRFWRLYPLHLVTLLGFIFLEGLEYVHEKIAGSVGDVSAFSVNNIKAIVNNVFLTHAFFEDKLTLNFPSWSISTEFYTYLLFGVLILFFSKRMCLVSFVIFSLSGISLFLMDGVGSTNGLSILRCCYGFFMGVFIFYVTKTIEAVTLPRNSGLIMLIFTIGIICLSQYFSKIFMPIVYGVLIFVLVKDDDSQYKKILGNRALVYLGTISYGIYMLHVGVWTVMDLFMTKVLKIPYVEIAGQSRLQLSVWQHSAALIIGMMIVLVAAHYSYWLIENRFRKGFSSQ